MFRPARSPVPRVALLAEGVDRNIYTPGEKTGMVLSPSSRRAWIEIPRRRPKESSQPVALLAEGVDRNTHSEPRKDEVIGRPPRGGRG